MGFVQQLFQNFAQRCVVKDFWLKQQWSTLGVEEATIEKRYVDIFSALIQYFKKVLECIHPIMKIAAGGL